MIAEFTVKNFYSIKKEQTLSFEATSDSFMDDEYCYEIKKGVRLLKLGIIYGANASGKTNVLMALSFLKDLMLKTPKDKTEAIDFSPFLLDSNSRNEESRMSLIFYLHKERYVLSISFDNERIYSEILQVYLSTQPSLLYKRTYNKESDFSDIVFGGKIDFSKNSQLAIVGNTINNSSVLASFGKSNVEKSRLNLVYDFFSKHIKSILRPNSSLESFTKKHLDRDTSGSLKRFIVNFLKASDFNIEDIQLKEENVLISKEMETIIQGSPIPEEVKIDMLKDGKLQHLNLLFKHRTECGVFELPEGVESRGTIRFMGIAIILKQLLLDQRFVSIDEVETSIHYELLAYLLKAFIANSENTSQMLVTTHDINLLNEDFVRRDVIWFTDKDSCGETKLFRLSSLGLHKNLSPYNAYKQGKLIKLPFLGSPYIDFNE